MRKRDSQNRVRELAGLAHNNNLWQFGEIGREHQFVFPSVLELHGHLLFNNPKFVQPRPLRTLGNAVNSKTLSSVCNTQMILVQTARVEKRLKFVGQKTTKSYRFTYLWIRLLMHSRKQNHQTRIHNSAHHIAETFWTSSPNPKCVGDNWGLFAGPYR